MLLNEVSSGKNNVLRSSHPVPHGKCTTNILINREKMNPIKNWLIFRKKNTHTTHTCTHSFIRFLPPLSSRKSDRFDFYFRIVFRCGYWMRVNMYECSFIHSQLTNYENNHLIVYIKEKWTHTVQDVFDLGNGIALTFSIST